MPVSPLDGPPFRGRRATALTRIVATVRSVLDPDSVEMEYLFEPSGQRFRWRALRSRVFTAGSLRPAPRHSTPAESLAVEFHLTGLLSGALTLLRGPRRPWTEPEILRFEVFRPLLAQLLESAAAAEIHAAARRRLESAAEAASTPILLVRPSGSVLYANRAAAALLSAREPASRRPERRPRDLARDLDRAPRGGSRRRRKVVRRPRRRPGPRSLGRAVRRRRGGRRRRSHAEGPVGALPRRRARETRDARRVRPRGRCRGRGARRASQRGDRAPPLHHGVDRQGPPQARLFEARRGLAIGPSESSRRGTPIGPETPAG